MFILGFISILLCIISVIVGEDLKSDLLPDRDVCGKQLEDKIVGGTQTGIREFPWMALLGVKSSSGRTSYVCGGSLINRRYILTAAHCIVDNLSVVRLGEHDVTKSKDCEDDKSGVEYCSEDPIDIEIENRIVYENFNKPVPNAGDIALLRLKKEVNYTNYVKPICLPLSDQLRNQSFENITLTVAGWGVTEKGRASDVKLKVYVPVSPNRNCSEVFKKYDLKIIDSQICAGGEKGRDSCYGDSGGPLMYRDRVKNGENFVICGIVSFGLDCGLENVPAVHTRVANFAEWIIKNIKP